MVKNEKGLTLMILVITIIVIIILAGVVMSINMNLNKSMELKEVVSNMEIIRTAAIPYRDKYVGDTVEEKKLEGNVESTIYHISDKFIGNHMDPYDSDIIKLLNYSDKVTIGTDIQYWFELDQAALDKLNVDIKAGPTKSDGSKVEGQYDRYFVNYYGDVEVAYCKSTTEHDNFIGIKVKKRFASTEGIKEKYVYFYTDLKNVKTNEVRN